MNRAPGSSPEILKIQDIRRKTLEISKPSRSRPIWTEFFVAFPHPTLTPHRYHWLPRVTLATTQITNQTITNPHTLQEPLYANHVPPNPPGLQTPGFNIDQSTGKHPLGAMNHTRKFSGTQDIQGYSTRWRSGSAQRTQVKRKPVLSRIEYVQSKWYAMQEKAKKEMSEYSVSHVSNAE